MELDKNKRKIFEDLPFVLLILHKALIGRLNRSISALKRLHI